MDLKPSPSPVSQRGGGLLPALLLLFVVLSLLFRLSYVPDDTLFSNDGPLATLMAQSHRLPEGFTGGWQDLNSIGYREGAGMPDVTYGLLLLLGPVGFSKFYAPIVLLLLGLGAWCFFRQLGLAPLACVLGSLAATLNCGFFSAACWGVGTHPLTIGLDFFALAALVDTSSPRRWLRVALAGFAVGLGVSEGADVGAIFSLFVAAFVIYQAWVSAGSRTRNLLTGVGRVALVAACAAFLAAQAVSVLVSTQIMGVAGTQQDTRTKAERWDFATQWSLPKRETLALLIPGLFGYRMDTPDGLPKALQEYYKGGEYWGAVGRDPAWDRYFAGGKQDPRPAGSLRFTGGGNYAGLLVVMVGFWAALQGLRKKDSVFSPANRHWLWFWSAVAAMALLLAFGRFAPFYRLFYALPYVSTIRNPTKFLHVFNWALVVLFAYGVHGLTKRYLEGATAQANGLSAHLKSWWAKASAFDKRWTRGALVAVAASLVSWLVYASSRDGLVKYLAEVGFPDQAVAAQIASFSFKEVGCFVLFLVLAVGLLTLILSGRFMGRQARWGAILLGLLLVVDLGRANLPWILYWDYPEKDASNPIIDRLRERPYEHRVAIFPLERFLRLDSLPPQARPLVEDYIALWNLYHPLSGWKQQQFPYYNVQSLDVVQMPRVPEDLKAYEIALGPAPLRHWELTNTRYLLGPTAIFDLLNQQLDAEHKRFRIAAQFDITPKPRATSTTDPEQWTAVTSTNGHFALFDFTGALPRVKLYTHWQVSTNDETTLKELASPTFDPAQAVLVAAPLPAPAPDSRAITNQTAGAVQFASYAPKRIVLQASADAPSVLLLNDRFDPNWQVSVDGKTNSLLRCNYIMRGVYLPTGTHRVEFSFKPPLAPFCVSLTAIGVGIALCGLLLVVKGPSTPQMPAEPAKPRAAPVAVPGPTQRNKKEAAVNPKK